jgi:hypothetical protein
VFYLSYPEGNPANKGIKMFSTISKTSQKLADMFTENTGRSFLDSGDAYGREWERNQGKTVQDFLDVPGAVCPLGDYPTLDMFNYLNERLTFNETAQALTAELVQALGDGLYDCWEQENWATELTGTKYNVWNSYNWENLLSGTIQGVDFKLPDGDTYVILQVHGGCDVRGGYTAPVVFRAIGEHWLYDCQTVDLFCKKCDLNISVNGQDVYNNDSDEYYAGYDLSKGCPNCQGEFAAYAPEASAWW